jgi:hypothetical protein
MSFEQSHFEFAEFAPPPEDILAMPDANVEQFRLFNPQNPQDNWKSPLERHSPVPDVLHMRSFDEDKKRFRVLDSSRKRRQHLFRVYEEVSKMRCLRDTRVIYDVELPIMAQLIGSEPTELEAWETPTYCDQPDKVIDESGLIYNTMRLFVIMDELGYSPTEVKEIISRDIKNISRHMLRGSGYQSFIRAVFDYLPSRKSRV